MTWHPDEPGVLTLPSGRLVRARSLRDLPGRTPDLGLYAASHEPTTTWPHLWIRWPDFWIPLHGHGARSAIRTAWGRAERERVEVACPGGVGRTGTLVAAMARLDGLSVTEAVAFARERHHPRAVETPWQRRWLAHPDLGADRNPRDTA